MGTISDYPNARYIPRAEDLPIDVRCVIGNGQSGSYTVLLEWEPLGYNQPTTIGTGAQVKGKESQVVATVRDIQKETNRTSITVFVREGEESTKLGPFNREVPEEGDTCIYTLTISHS